MSAALFGGTSQHTSRNLVEFRAGKMTLRDKTVTADNRKGLFYITAGEDSLLHVCWKERSASSPEMDLTVFPDDSEFIRLPQCKTGRVYLLRFKAHPSRKHFFWLQEPSEKRDAELEKKVQELLREGAPPTRSSANSLGAALGAALGGDDELQRSIMQDPAQFMQLMSSMGLADAFRSSLASGPSTQRGTPQPSARGARPRAAPAPPPATQVTPAPAGPAATPGAPKPSKVQFKLADLESALSTLHAPGDADSFEFADVLRPDELAKLLENEAMRARLVPFLPEGEREQFSRVSSAQQAREMAEVLRSPQFRQALNAFGEALRSGQLGPVLIQFGLPESAANAAASGSISDFARALQTALGNPPSASASAKADEDKKDETQPKKSDDDKMDQD